MNISFLPVNFKNIDNLSFKSSQVMTNTLPCDSFEVKYDYYNTEEQIKVIKVFDNQINRLKSEIAGLRSSKGNNRAEINYLKRQVEKLILQKGQMLSKFNKNVEFLYSKRNSAKKVQDYLDLHKEIIPISLLNKSDDENVRDLWRRGDFFIINDTPYGAYLDSSYEPNMENYKRLSDFGTRTLKEIKEETGMSIFDIQMLLQEGYIKPLTLKKLDTKEEIPTNLINVNNSYNREALRKFNKRSICSLSPLVYCSQLTAKYLSNFGFGNEKELFEAVKKGKIRGIIVSQKTKTGTNQTARILFNDPETKSALLKMRLNNPNILDERKLHELTGISKFELENALKDNEIEPIKFCIYPEDENKIFIDLKNPKNLNFVYKKAIERTIFEGQSRKKDSTILKLTFKLCKNTRKIGNELISSSPRLKDIAKNKNKTITFEDMLALKNFSKTLWQKAGEEELQQARLRVKASVSEYKEKGIEGIKDEEIKELFKIALKS